MANLNEVKGKMKEKGKGEYFQQKQQFFEPMRGHKRVDSVWPTHERHTETVSLFP